MPEKVLDRLASLARGTGTSVHVVGGYVRDHLLGRRPLDVDLLVEGDAAPFLAALSRQTGSQAVVFSRKRPVTYRTTLGETVIDLSEYETGRLDLALARRDFTINALAVPLEKAISGGLDSPVDLLGGMQDLRARHVRHVTIEGLEEDPVRLLRAVRLVVLLEGFRLETLTQQAILERAGSLAGAPAERLRAELEMILASGSAGAGLRLMRECGILFHLFPELTPMDGLVQNRWHDHDALEHTLRCVEEADRLQAGHAAIGVEAALDPIEAVILKWSALFHDTGKAATAGRDASGEIHFLGHETVSSEIAGQALRRFLVGRSDLERVRHLIANHLRLPLLAEQESVTDRALRRLVHDVEHDTPLLGLLAVADRRAAGGPQPAERLARLEQTAARTIETFKTQGDLLVRPRPLLTGTEIMRILDLRPGPRVGTILRWLTRQQVERRLASRDEAIRLLKSLPASRLDSLDEERGERLDRSTEGNDADRIRAPMPALSARDSTGRPMPDHVKLFIPGPTEVRSDVLAEMARAPISHRGEEIAALQRSVSGQVATIMGTRHPVLLSSSSATGLMEGGIRNGVERGVLGLVCGAFSMRWHRIAKDCGKMAETLEVPWGRAIRPEAVDVALATGKYDAVTVAHNETSTGVTNPLGEIARVMQKYPDVLFLVDAVSSLGGLPLIVDDLGIDLCLASVQKAMALPPGFAVCCVSPKMMERSRRARDKGYYFDFARMLEKAEKGQPLTTPSISHMYALERQCKHILEEGLEPRWERHRRMARMVRDWAKDRFELFAEEAHASDTLTCIRNSRGIDVAGLIAALRAQGMLIGNGYGELKGKAFRIAHMGELMPGDISELLSAIDSWIEAS